MWKDQVKVACHEKIRIWKSLPTMKITWSQNYPWKSLKLLTMFCVYNCMHTACYNDVKPWSNGFFTNSSKLVTYPMTSLFLHVTTLLKLIFFSCWLYRIEPVNTSDMPNWTRQILGELEPLLAGGSILIFLNIRSITIK